MSDKTHPILIGCSGWSYPDWEGPFYPPGTDPADYLAWYADRFPIVEVDSSFYRPPTPRMVRGWYNRTPRDFKFALKVPQVITHQKQLRDCEEEVDGFVSSVQPLGEKLSCALLQLGYFNRGAFGSLEEFVPVLDDFLTAWPHERVPLAVEIRNPRWVCEAFTDVLRRHNAALTLTEQKWMPTAPEVASRLDPVTGLFSFVRLIGDREAIEKITTSWDRQVIDRSAGLAATADVIRAVATRVPVVVFANNHYAGYSPETARRLRELLGLPEPVPPARPRTTLFD
ncbi:MAG: DUF72 domain-containing protein [Planctomycetia bacterium]|nr:DUF72 domain-containing protein [Planctomycetia bacterium]